MGNWDLGFGVWGLGVGVWELVFRGWGLGVGGWEFVVWGSLFRGLGFEAIPLRPKALTTQPQAPHNQVSNPFRCARAVANASAHRQRVT